MRTELIFANLQVVIGTLLITGGGILATMGWNSRSSATQRMGMIRAVSAEFMMNINIFNDPKFTTSDESELAKYVVFPRMQTSALRGVIASGLFVEQKDRVLLTRVMNLLEVLEDFNKRLAITEDVTSQNPNKILSFRKKLGEGKTKDSIRMKLKKFGELLMSNYGIKSEDTFFVKLDD
jgi:hypothetical protein